MPACERELKAALGLDGGGELELCDGEKTTRRRWQVVGLRETNALRAGYRRDDLGRGWRKGSTTLWSEQGNRDTGGKAWCDGATRATLQRCGLMVRADTTVRLGWAVGGVGFGVWVPRFVCDFVIMVVTVV
ncbi:hypothetical protein M0R45_025893 [Rubus argutus]|uniref:MHC class I antigen n=1 Tax=Rubus argutus TaxID=59490 RepID=A0AAW1WXQ9_RUBAR